MDKLTDLTHLFVTVFLSGLAGTIVAPAIIDVTMTALCPGLDECSLAIYLSGFQQAITGAGTIVMMPLIGNLSDVYGRKALLTLPLTLSILPLVILAYSRETNFFYAYYVLRTLTAMVSEGSMHCLALAYVADNISEGKRALAFGVLSGVGLASFVCGTSASRFLPTGLAFQVAAFVSILAVVYMRIFLTESVPGGENCRQPLLETGPNDEKEDGDQPRKKPELEKFLPVGDLITLLRSSVPFSQAAVVTLFSSLAEGGIMSSFLYYLKARFHFNKNDYANLMLITGLAGVVSQLFFMPLLTPYVSEEKLLSIGLFTGFTQMLLNSIAWAAWVPYAIPVLIVFSAFGAPCLSSIVSKQVGPDEQGKAQGCISSIKSFANIISPLIFSPLTAFFLSEDAPFDFPGFSILCIGLLTMIGFIQSLMIRPAPPTSSHKISSSCMEA